MSRRGSGGESEWPAAQVAATLQRVFALCAGGQPAEVTDGWREVAGHVLAIYGASEDAESSFTVAGLAAALHGAYGRAPDAADPRDFERLAPAERLAWEMVARHSAALMAADPDETDADALGEIETAWGDRYRQQAQMRGIALEPSESARAG